MLIKLESMCLLSSRAEQASATVRVAEQLETLMQTLALAGIQGKGSRRRA